MASVPPYKQLPVDGLIPYARNARVHSDRQIDQIAASIREFGFLSPVVVDAEGGVIAGHGRVMAARRLGLDTVPAVEAAHLTEAQKRAYVIADNRLAELASWDDEMLQAEFEELQELDFDMELTGFDLDEIAAFGSQPNDEPGESRTQEIHPDSYELKHRCPKCGFEFDDD